MKFQELSTQMALKQMETPPPPPPAAPTPAKSDSATITSNTPLIISTQMCKIETQTVVGGAGVHPSLVASPAHHGLPGMYQPAYAAPPPGAYYAAQFPHGYGYDDPTGHMMAAAAASTPSGPHGLGQGQYQGFEEVEMVSGLSMGRNIGHQVMPQPVYGASPMGVLGGQQVMNQIPVQQQQQQQAGKTMLIKDPNAPAAAARMAVPDVASRTGAYFAPAATDKPPATTPVHPTSAINATDEQRGITDVSPPPLGTRGAGSKNESPLLLSMLASEDRNMGKGQLGVGAPGGGVASATSPQPGKGIPLALVTHHNKGYLIMSARLIQRKTKSLNSGPQFL